MRVVQLMTANVTSVPSDQSLSTAAQLMWDSDCGAIPVREVGSAKVIGVLTDRDICMACWSKNLPPADIRVLDAMSSPLISCRANDAISTAESMMRANKIRRLPVVDSEGRLVGMLSIADIARNIGRAPFRGDPDLSPEQFAYTVAEICGARETQAAQRRAST
jgi:CBS-domain-containing membrane protein